MITLKKFILIVLSIFCLFITSPVYAAGEFANWYNSLSDNQKVSQLFITGLRGKILSNSEKKLFKEWPVSGVIYFKRNFENELQFKNLDSEVKSFLTEPLLTFTDQEGGDVNRFGTRYDNPTALSVGTLENNKLPKYLGYTNGTLLNNFNIASNLAPVVDIKDPKLNDFISNRSYGSDAELVSKISLEYSKGLLSSGVLPTLKHFPGLGGVLVDNHKKTSVKRSTKEKLLKNDWLPYITHQKAKLPFLVMTSHTQLFVDDIDYGNTTYSKKALNRLRSITDKKLVVMTDDLQMSGATISGQSFQESAYQSFMAGHDLLLVAWAGKNLTDSLSYFKRKLETDTDFKERLKISLARIYRIKKITSKLKSKEPSLSILKSLKLSSYINSKITNLHLSRAILKGTNTLTKKENMNLNDFLIFSSDTLFKKPFHSKVKTYSLLKTSGKNIVDLCKKKACVLHLTGKKTSSKINQILNLSSSNNDNHNLIEPSINERVPSSEDKTSLKTGENTDIIFTIINSVDPNLINDDNRFKHNVLDVMTRSYKLGDQILQILHNQTKKNILLEENS